MERILTEAEARAEFDANPLPDLKPRPKMPPFTLAAEIDTRKQPLRKIRPAFRARASISSLLPDQARLVLALLFQCFERQGNVQEGLIGDLMWGFEQPIDGIPPEATFQGLEQLRQFGYLKFQAPDGSFIDPTSDQIGKAWVRYQPKLLEMVYE